MACVGCDLVPIYLGDDINDEDAFLAVRENGISVSVGGSPEADYYLRNQGEVAKFLALLTGDALGRNQQSEKEN